MNGDNWNKINQIESTIINITFMNENNWTIIIQSINLFLVDLVNDRYLSLFQYGSIENNPTRISLAFKNILIKAYEIYFYDKCSNKKFDVVFVQRTNIYDAPYNCFLHKGVKHKLV